METLEPFETKLETKMQSEQQSEEGTFVDQKTADLYIKESGKGGLWIGAGVMLCIFSPIGVILGNDLGVVMMLAAIAAAVGIFISSGFRMDRFEYLKRENLILETGLESRLRKEKENVVHKTALLMAVGVGLCILSITPEIAAEVLFPEADWAEHLSAIALFVLVGLGVFCIVTACTRTDCYHVLLQEEDYSVKNKQRKLAKQIAPIYWLVVTAIYLGWSFITWGWDHTWIIWPVAGVLFGAIVVICNVIEEQMKKV